MDNKRKYSNLARGRIGVFEIRDIKVFLEHLDKLQTVKRKEM